jgi:C4-dicarboxylate transporter, DctQ subunit
LREAGAGKEKTMLGAVIAILHRLEEGFLAFLLAGMTLVTFTQVVARYIFNTGAIWALELTSFLFAWLVILGIAYGIRIHAHIGVDAFVKLFRAPVQRIFGLLATAASLGYAVLMLVGAWDQTFGVIWEIDIESEDLKIPLWVPMSVLVWGFALMIWRLLVVAYRIAIFGETSIVLGDESREALERHPVDLDNTDDAAGKPDGPRS